MNHTEFKNSSLYQASESLTSKLVMVALTVTLLGACVYFFAQAIH